MAEYARQNDEETPLRRVFDTGVADSYPMGVLAKVIHNLSGITQRRFGQTVEMLRNLRNSMNVVFKSALSLTTRGNLLFEGSVHTVEAGNGCHGATNNREFRFLFHDVEH